MDEVGRLTGRSYHLFDYAGAPDAEDVIVIMGSGADVCEETVNYLNARRREAGRAQGAPVPAVRGGPVRGGAAGHVPARRGCSTARRSRAAWASPLYTDVVAALMEQGRGGDRR